MVELLTLRGKCSPLRAKAAHSSGHLPPISEQRCWSLAERIVPLNEEAARAIQDVQTIRQRERDRGFQDTQTGVLTRYLFVRRGKRLSYDYLFAHALEEACQAAGLMTPDSHPTITPIVFGTPWEPNWPNEEHGHEPLWPSLDIRRQACP